jgi:GT2 family glycosyltransferase/glycosyltransferase involved in cell wall biosynthesis
VAVTVHRVAPSVHLVTPTVSIVVPVFDQLAFTRQCLDRVARSTSDRIRYEVIIVDNGSSDGTHEYFTRGGGVGPTIRYVRHDRNLGFAKANNAGAALSTSRFLLLLNNDTLVQPGWLDEMMALAESDRAIGIVGIKQLFPYTNRLHHTGIVFSPGARPVHLYPHADARLPHVNKQREYQAVNGACLLIARDLYEQCGGLDEGYRNGYEDVDLCMKVAQRGRRIVCCTRACIYHYGQTTDTRTADDRDNAAYFASKWRRHVTIDEPAFLRQDAADRTRAAATAVRTPARAPQRLSDDVVYLADDLSRESALTWLNIQLALALKALGVPVHIGPAPLPASTNGAARRVLDRMRLAGPPQGGVQIKWSHYWPQHLNLELTGSLNLELFTINYRFARPTSEPWDHWLQCVARNGLRKLPLSVFCLDVLQQLGVPAPDCDVLHPGYSPEIDRVGTEPRRSDAFRFLTVTNSHDLERYGTTLLLDAYWRTFAADASVVLVVKDYGASSGNPALRQLISRASDRARVELLTEFTSKERLIALYRSCDAFVTAHRGEGFAMKILDAMACGLPTITPLFGGPADYCTASNCYAVDYALVPMTSGLDTRLLTIANGPMWAEPDRGSLERQLRAVHENPAAARAIGEAARQEVASQFTWDRSARALLSIVGRIREAGIGQSPAVSAPPPGVAAARSPYWLGVRVSVVIPTFNRREKLLRCLSALERQSVLPQEFEVIVIDDGSTEGTAEAVRARAFPFSLKLIRQVNQGPAAARNAGVAMAEGEIVLFMGDDIVADEHLLEAHLLAHAARPDPADAVLGHVEWPRETPPNAVMEYVSGVGSRQFAYEYIPHLPALDFRFFYTSNVSVKRQFLLDAAEVGVRFDPSFRYAAYEDSEFAYRLARLGLRIAYAKEARAYHDHWMDLEGFGAREFTVGRMAVVLYRKHPMLDALVGVRWIEDHTDLVHRFIAHPDLLEKLRNLDGRTDACLLSLARELEGRLAVDPTGGPGDSLTHQQLRALLHRVLDTVFDVQRTRGKVEEWYVGVADRQITDAARTVVGVMRKLERLHANGRELGRATPTVEAMPAELAMNLREHVQVLEAEIGRPLFRRPSMTTRALARIAAIVRLALLQRTVFTQLRAVDAYLVEWLPRHSGDGLAHYLRARNRLRRLLL